MGLLYDWYLDIWEQKSGWWWEVFGEDGEFSVLDAIAIGLLAESKMTWAWDDIFYEAEVRELYQQCTGTSCSLEEIVNFAAIHYQAVADRVKAGLNPDKQYTWTENIAAVNKMIANFKNPAVSDWRNGRRSDRPWGSANDSYPVTELGYSKPEWRKIKNHYSSKFFYMENACYVPSGCVEEKLNKHWTHEDIYSEGWKKCVDVR